MAIPKTEGRDDFNALIDELKPKLKAFGRDYSDVVPIKGTMRMSGRQKHHQAVDMIPLIPPPEESV